MFAHYLTTAFRNLYKHKFYSSISILGLATGMAVCLLVFAFVNHERGFDSMHPDGSRLYRLTWEDLGSSTRFATFQNPMGPLLAAGLPEIESQSRFLMRETLISVADSSHYIDVNMVDNNYFEMFKHQSFIGNPDAAIEDLNSAILTVAAAERLFGETDVVGQVFTLNNEFDYTVAAVIQNNPTNSHLVANLFINLNNAPRIFHIDNVLEQVRSDIVYQYVKLYSSANLTELEVKTANYIRDNIDPTYDRKVHYQALSDIHFTTYFQNEIPTSDPLTGVTKPFRERSDLLIFSAAALLTLLIATLNFINLFVVQGFRRSREIGVRCIVGATRLEVVRQFYFEILLMSLIAMLFAVSIYQAVTPIFASIVSIPESSFALFPEKILALLGLAIGVGLLAGFYPALLLAGIGTVRALRAQLAESIGSSKFRSALVVAQFSISIGLIIAASVVNSQIQFAFTKPLGFNPQNVVLVDMGNREASAEYVNLYNQLNAEPDIESVTVGSQVPTQSLGEGALFSTTGGTANFPYSTRRVNAGTDYFKTLGIEMVAGRDFNQEIQSDRLSRASADQPFYAGVILNETAARAMGWTNPNDAIGKQITGDIPGIVFTATIIGVASDMHYQSIRTQVEPVSYLYIATRGTMAIRFKAGRASSALSAIDRVWNQNVPNFPIQRSFLVDDYEKLYSGENRSFRLFTVLSLVAIVIASLGLFALASSVTEQRIKEIGIRKVLGATVTSIASMLAWKFSKLVIFSNLLAWPLAWLFMDHWLGNFPYRTDISASVFLLAGLITFAVAILTTFQRVYVVATRNPIISLRMDS